LRKEATRTDPSADRAHYTWARAGHWPICRLRCNSYRSPTAWLSLWC